MNSNESFRVRYRFRVNKRLYIKSRQYEFVVGGRNVVLAASMPDTDISDSEWLVINARSFQSEAEARSFAHQLKSSSDVASVGARVGINSGIDIPTSGVAKAVKEHVREQTGILLRDNVHGVDVFPDSEDVRIAQISAVGTVSVHADPFLADISRHFKAVENLSQTTQDIVLLLNYALMVTDPVAQMVFAVSAVEMLGQCEKWNAAQEELLTQIADSVMSFQIASDDEKAEVADAIRKGTHKLSLRQGVRRLLTSLGLDHLKPVWDDLYSKRSTLVHGLAPKPGADYTQLAHEVVTLCGQILLKVISLEVRDADAHVTRLYEMPKP